MPHSTAPVFDVQAMTLLAPVAVILVAENLPGISGRLGARTGQNLDRYIGRVTSRRWARDRRFLGCRRHWSWTAHCAGNIGVMGVDRIYSTLVFVIAALIALVLGFRRSWRGDPEPFRALCSAAFRLSCSV